MRIQTIRMIRLVATVIACALLPSLALAETPDAQQGGFRMQMGSQMGRFNVDRTQLTDDQKQAYDKALSDYAAVEDQALAALVAAGDVTQQESDRFTRVRDQQGAMASLEMASWTNEQQQSFQAAMTASDDERATAFAALVASGLITQAQADAFANMGGGFVNRRPDGAQADQPPADGAQFTRGGNPPEGMPQDGTQRVARNFDIWTEIQSRDQTASIQSSLTTIQAAQQAFAEALSGAGIQMAS